MKQKKTPDKKQNSPNAAMIGFLELLNAISLSPDAREYCTPGHKAGRGFKAIFPPALLTPFPEEAYRHVE